MQWGAGNPRAHIARIACGSIKHVGRSDGPAPESVETTPIEIVAGGLRISEVAFLRDREGVPNIGGLIRVNGLAAQFINEKPASSERLIANHHRGKTEAGPARVKSVLWIAFEQSRRDAR